MHINFQTKSEPLCRFGPGGDFTFNLPAKNYNPRRVSPKTPENLIKTLLGLLSTLLSPKLEPSELPKTLGEASKPQKDNKYETISTGTNRGPETQEITTLKNNKFIPKQKFLFPDYCRTRIKYAAKQKHRVRTHRRAKKKSDALRTTRQGSLFEINFQSAKTA